MVIFTKRLHLKIHRALLAGHTPLHCAVLANQSACVSKLVEMGALPTHMTMLHRPRPPLHRYFYTASTALTPETNQLQHSGANTLMAGRRGMQVDPRFTAACFQTFRPLVLETKIPSKV